MGIQDRDYYREKYKQASPGNSPDFVVNQKTPRRQVKTPSSAPYLLFPVLTIAALWYGADAFLTFQQAKRQTEIPLPVASAPQAQPKSNLISPKAGGVVLKTDPQGHFRGTVLVNNVPMPFLIDTGATKTVIPSRMAIQAGLPVGGVVQSNTAGGKVSDRATQITSLVLGSAVIKNLDAHINDHLDEVLIGMNTLKYFQMTQTGNTLTLVANNQAGNRPANQSMTSLETMAANQAIKKPTTIEKTVHCDEHKVCTTTYSDH
ncbi:retropepsin-like aspartic protease family protein [Methylomonas methanica]|uniref:Aspartyl protease n=1 Tax=Methylomonas methanica TaxID=421 RepID=A0A177LT24_METMH|nr:retropepsin-like aspartic protease [Methylomonas methanica]OAH96403.1 aspartyl protease [Methylomonas methanica]